MFHALWEMVPFLGGVWEADFGQLILIGIIVNAVMGAGLWWFVVRKRRGVSCSANSLLSSTAHFTLRKGSVFISGCILKFRGVFLPLPAFDNRGMLPPFTGTTATESANRSPYSCTIIELCAAFGTSDHRKKLLANLIAYRRLIATGGYVVGLQFIDGSFVENVERSEGRAPNDIDVFSILPPPPRYHNDPSGWKIDCLSFWNSEIIDNAKNKARFSLDCYAMIEDEKNLGTFLGRVDKVDSQIT